jgi:hypothetical protein
LKVTSRGLKLLLIQLILATSTLIYRDFLLLIATLLAFSIMMFSVYKTVRAKRWLRIVECEPRNVRLKMMAGEEKDLSLFIYSPIDLKLVNLPDWLKVSDSILKSGVNKVKLMISPRIGKVYRLDHLTAAFTDPLKILYVDFEIQFELEVVAYPRVLPFIVEALKMIGQADLGGEVASSRKGRGTEYLWSREYQLGDSLTSIDWKASARLEKLIVKEFSEEAYRAIGIVFDVRAIGPVTSDEINALFLSSTISAARRGIPTTLILKNGSTLISEYRSTDPDTLIKIAISYSIKNYIASGWDVYELLEPKTASQILLIIRELEGSGLLEALHLKMESLNEALSKLPLKEGLIYYVGNVILDSEFVLELSRRVRTNKGELVVLTSEKPWVDLGSLEQAYIMHLSYSKILDALRGIGSKVMFYREASKRMHEVTILA